MKQSRNQRKRRGPRIECVRAEEDHASLIGISEVSAAALLLLLGGELLRAARLLAARRLGRTACRRLQRRRGRRRRILRSGRDLASCLRRDAGRRRGHRHGLHGGRHEGAGRVHEVVLVLRLREGLEGAGAGRSHGEDGHQLVLRQRLGLIGHRGHGCGRLLVELGHRNGGAVDWHLCGAGPVNVGRRRHLHGGSRLGSGDGHH
mmetsp:Transcript_3864/g.7787  ORF Transcript_3864/g.7787 Transcript_3864/m.7787 type:complete len:204 (-) Transcript_3864:85-696(-)